MRDFKNVPADSRAENVHPEETSWGGLQEGGSRCLINQNWRTGCPRMHKGLGKEELSWASGHPEQDRGEAGSVRNRIKLLSWPPIRIIQKALPMFPFQHRPTASCKTIVGKEQTVNVRTLTTSRSTHTGQKRVKGRIFQSWETSEKGSRQRNEWRIFSSAGFWPYAWVAFSDSQKACPCRTKESLLAATMESLCSAMKTQQRQKQKNKLVLLKKKERKP